MKNSSPVRALLFDFGGVIAEEGFANGLTALAREQSLDTGNITVEGMHAVYDSGFVLGHGSEADFWALMRQRTGLYGDDNSLTEKILDGFTVRDWMIELVNDLHDKGYIVGILSDQTHWLDILNQRYQFYPAFDQIYNSYYLGKGKQDASLFKDIAFNLGLATESIVFIDDTKNNVDRAASVGMHGIHYTDKASLMKQLAILLDAQ